MCSCCGSILFSIIIQNEWDTAWCVRDSGVVVVYGCAVALNCSNTSPSNTGSIPRYPLWSHTLLCIENYLCIVLIIPIRNKELIFIFYLFLLFVLLIEDRYNYYKINIIYTCFFRSLLQCNLFTMLSVFWCRHRFFVLLV